MAGAKSNPPKPRKRVEAETLKRARDGSAFTKCEACNKDVPVVLIDMHSCSLDSKIRLSLEAQVVEKVVEAKKPEKKRSPLSSVKKEGSAKKAKKSEGSNKRKRPPTAFFVFMDDFRKEFKEANPDKQKGSLVAKEGGDKWKSMTDEEKKPYIEKAAQLKAEYKKAVGEDNNAENEGEDAIEENEGTNSAARLGSSGCAPNAIQRSLSPQNTRRTNFTSSGYAPNAFHPFDGASRVLLANSREQQSRFRK